jgi:hypothetical protein
MKGKGKMKKRYILILTILIASPFLRSLSAGQNSQSPPNQPAELTIEHGQIFMEYEGLPLFKAEIHAFGKNFRVNRVAEKTHGCVTQLVILTAQSFEDEIEVAGTIVGSHESFPCEADRRDQGIAIVRHSYGPSHSLLNRGIYDRSRDWVLSVDHNPEVTITPTEEETGRHTYDITIRGREIVIRFRPLFYQRHRGLKYFEPWRYKVWPEPIVGWCSWFAYFTEITEANIKKTADVLSEILSPYGYEYLQIDDGYQRAEGLPESWLRSNQKFPGGLKYLAEYIKSKDLKPGIWTNVSFDQEDFAEKNKEYFLLDERGRVARGNWIDISVDGSNAKAVDQIIRPLYRGLKQMGWEYYKVDALRHLRYEGYNSHPEYFKKKNVERIDAYRHLVLAIREEIGRENFMLGCWGIRPELIGIIDGCRIGTDGFSFAGLSQYNSFNNVIWRNDPDHIELSPEEAYRSTMVTSLTGSLFLLTDKPEVYRTDIVEPALRAAPVLFTQPCQIFDVDPSRSGQLDRVDVEVSGSGPRVFDASRTPKVHLFLLEINKPFENWMLLGRTGGKYDIILFKDLGLRPDKEYYVFEFWSKRLIGSFSGSFSPGKIDAKYNCQLFCIRERLDRPQVIATNRHITCGGYDLEALGWRNNILSGKSRLVGNDSYILYLTEPSGFAFKNASCEGADVEEIQKKGSLVLISILSKTNASIAWKAEFEIVR